jgi:DNA-binding response OmpR family regulator
MLPASPAPSKPATILLVDDSPRVRPLVRQILVEAGWNVLDVGLPQEALSLLDSHQDHITLLLTDVMMPGMSGLELSERARIRRPDLKVLCMSGYDAYRGNHPGVEFIEKPFRPHELVAKVRQVLEP